MQIIAIALLAVIAACSAVTMVAALRLAAFAKLRKPFAQFLKQGTKVFEKPIEVAEMTERLVTDIGAIAQGAVMSHDVMRFHDDRQKAWQGQNGAGAQPGNGAPADPKVPQPELFGAGGASEHVEGGVSYTSNDAPGPANRPAGALNRDTRDITLGAPSQPDGTAA